MAADWIRPAFATAGVGALMSTRAGGVSREPFASLNLGTAVGDDPAAVAENRRRFAAATGAAPVWLKQVHGTRVVTLTPADAAPGAPVHDADACVTSEPGVACVIQVADCLPVLFAAPEGRAVAGAHAGWRGLAAGVLEATVAALCRHSGAEPRDIEAWLGPCIGANEFEVGPDVLAGFGVDETDLHPRFVERNGQHGKWLADLPGLAEDRLAGLGLERIHGGGWCTVSDASRFFSFRRDRPLFGNSGRLAAAIWRDA
jgi:polyphenol oxidase